MPKIFIVIGPPGSGKGTQTELLAGKTGLYSFETSKILEESWAKAKEEDFAEVGGKKFYLLKEKELFDKGILCSPPFVTYLVEKRIRELSAENKGIIFSGSPRTVYEGENLIPILKDLYGAENIAVMELMVGDKEAIWRNTRRKICSLCRYPLPYSEETRNLEICPRCGGPLRTRTLDNEETMKVRLEEYKNRTKPLLDYVKNQSIKIIEINGEQSIEDVHKEVMEKIGEN